MRLASALTLRRRCAPAATRPFSPAASPRLVALRARLASEPRATGGAAAFPNAEPPSSAEPRAPLAPAALVDGFGRRHTYLRVSLTERCNLRCSYCMPAGGLPHLTGAPQLLSPREHERLLALFVSLGISKCRLTGGEPTLHADLPRVVATLDALRPAGLRTIAMTTNGLLLERLLAPLQAAGLTHLNISLDSLRPARFAQLSRRPEAAFHRVWAAIQLALSAGLEGPVKLNVVVVRGVNEDEAADFAELTLALPLEVRFIELMPFAGNNFDAAAAVGWRETADAIQRRFPGFAPDAMAGDTTARLWRVPGASGAVGFVATMTDAFCGSCSRLRLTADGAVRACLHGDEEHSLRDALRAGADDAQLAAIVAAALRGKHRALGGRGNASGLARAAASQGAPQGAGLRKRAMIEIGG